jgi:hypothetical protein
LPLPEMDSTEFRCRRQKINQIEEKWQWYVLKSGEHWHLNKISFFIMIGCQKTCARPK